MKVILSLLLVLLLVLSPVTACRGSGTLTQTTATWDSGSTDLSLQRLINIVADRHDEYVNNDPVLAPEEKSSQLAESMVVRMAFTVRTVETNTIRAQLNAVLDRHDLYVNADPDIGPAQKKLALFSSANIRRTIAESR